MLPGLNARPYPWVRATWLNELHDLFFSNPPRKDDWHLVECEPWAYCSQCGGSVYHAACGPTHVILLQRRRDWVHRNDELYLRGSKP